ncbi:MAG: Dihydroxy-acid dehydratase, partial [uncultured Ramlibacter sp.]
GTHEEARGVAQPPLVRGRWHARVRPPPADPADGVAARGRHRPAHHRPHQHVERPVALPRTPARACRGGQARRHAGRRHALRAPGDEPGRSVGQADHHAVPELPGDGSGGAAALAARGRRGAAGRLRQDRARHGDGSPQRRPARPLLPCRPDAERPLRASRPACAAGGCRDAHAQVLGRVPGRGHRQEGVDPAGDLHDALARHLQHHGDRQHDGVPGGSARPGPARLHRHSRGRLGAPPDGRPMRAAHRGDGLGGPRAVPDADGGLLPQCRRRAHGPGWLHECSDPPDRDGTAGRCAPHAGAAGRHRARGPGAGQSLPERRRADGGLLLRRRTAGAAAPGARQALARRAHGKRQDAGRKHPRMRAARHQGDPAPVGSRGAKRRAGGPDRQPRTRGRRDQAQRRDAR